MQKQGDITGKTLHIDGYVQFPGSLHLNNTQTALNTSGTVGDAGIWFADNTSQGLIAESGKNRMVEIWNHDTMTVSNSHMDLSGFAAVTGGSDANSFIVLNNGMITQDTSNYGVADAPSKTVSCSMVPARSPSVTCSRMKAGSTTAFPWNPAPWLSIQTGSGSMSQMRQSA